MLGPVLLRAEVAGRPNFEDLAGSHLLAAADIGLAGGPDETGPHPSQTVLRNIIAKRRRPRCRGSISHPLPDQAARGGNLDGGTHSFFASHIGIEAFLGPDAGAIARGIESRQRAALCAVEDGGVAAPFPLEGHSATRRVQQFHHGHGADAENDRIAGQLAWRAVRLVLPIRAGSNRHHRYNARRTHINAFDGMTAVHGDAGRGHSAL